MRNEVESMIGTIDKVMEKAGQLISLNTLKDMSLEDFEMAQLCLKLFDESKEVIKAEADQLDRIEQKLDKLLSAKKIEA